MSVRPAAVLAAAGILVIWTGAVHARADDEVRPTSRTIKDFERYVAAAESRPSSSFLHIDSLSAEARADALKSLRDGEFVVDRVSVTDSRKKKIDIHDGAVHHWRGTVFVPGVRLDAAVALLQDYDRHAKVYSQNVVASRLRSRQGNRFDFYLRFRMQKVITVVVDSEHRAQFTPEGPDRVSSRIYSTRTAEVENPGEEDERQVPPEDAQGFLWRLNSYWKFLERDGGVYIQCESISLTRDIPWYLTLVRGLVTSIPRESLDYTMTRTREALTASRPGVQAQRSAKP